MTNWTTDEHGNRDFRHGRWCVRIWNKEWTSGRIEVTTDSDCADVVVEAEGMWVNGVSSGSWHDGPHAFTIPWEVITAVVEARAIVGC
jgi:hypothetical protein